MKITIEKNIDKRLDIYLTNYLDYSRNQIADIIDNALVLINGKKQKSSYKLKTNDVLEYDENEIEAFLNPDKELKPFEFKLDIKYEDDDLIVLNKPKGILTHPTKYEKEKTIANALVYHCGGNLANINSQRAGIVHRLDKNTAGLMIAVKNDKYYSDIANQIKNKTLIRKYKAIVLGSPFGKKEGTINKSLVHYMKDNVKMLTVENEDEGLKAITKYKVLEEFKGASLVELELKTGRTHQIRVHMASTNHPVFGDTLYGAKSFMINEFYNLKTQEQLLQSYYISFEHPSLKKRMEFCLKENEFSEDFIKVLKFLRSKKNEH